MQQQFLDQRKLSWSSSCDRPSTAVIHNTAISSELCDLMLGYLIFRSLISSPSPTQHTVQTLVDDVILPSLTRRAG